MFEVTGDDISRLDDVELRKLVTELSLAELGRLELPLSGVTAGGDQNAADGGIDVRVSRPTGSVTGDFIPREETGIQVKLSDMPRAEILKEMRPGGTLRPVIATLAANGGAYLIVSGKGTVADSRLTERRDAMREAVAGHANAAALHTDFYDRERVANWVRIYPGIAAWVRQRIGRAVKGWQPLANWSEGGPASQPYIIDDAGCITDERTAEQESLPILEGISRLRQSLIQPRKCVRLIGLSGLGKTRLVEALFDGEVGIDPLPAAEAVYTDNADEPDPSARDLARQFVETGQRAILIVDNCNPETHAALTKICNANGSRISLITVEYDVRDDEPEGTDVFRLGAASEGVIDQWLERSCQHVSQVDRGRIALLSDGNFRVAKALAHTITKGETLGRLTDRELFERIFHQRNVRDRGLMKAAEICSLVYSFDGEDTSPTSELARLAALAGQTIDQLYGYVSELKQRGILQSRSRWRAVLPHAIANRLAGYALEWITRNRFDEFSASIQLRQLKSLSRRLGYLHDIPAAQAIVARWLAPEGLLVDLSALSEEGYAILRNVAPVAPETVLELMENSLSGGQASQILANTNVYRRHWIELLKALAYEPSAFTRATRLLAQFIAVQSKSNKSDRAEHLFGDLFHLYLSGTKATPDQRRLVVRDFLLSEDPALRECGFTALRAMFQTHYSSATGSFDFGARPRDYGWRPNTYGEVRAWSVDGIALVASLLGHKVIAPQLRSSIAGNFRSLWSIDACRKPLEEIAETITNDTQWTEGWIAVRMTLRYDSKHLDPTAIARLKTLEQQLKPPNFGEMARAYVFSVRWGSLDIAEGDDDDLDPGAADQLAMERIKALGIEIAGKPELLNEFLDEAAVASGPRIYEFGLGLALGAQDVKSLWLQITTALERKPQDDRRVDIACGFLEGLAKRDAPELEQYLDDAIQDITLAPYFPILQCAAGLSERGIERLQSSLDHGVAKAWSFRQLEFGGATKPIPGAILAALLSRIEVMPNGSEVAIDILRMRFFGDQKDGIVIDDALIQFGQWLLETTELTGNNIHDHRLGEIASVCLVGPRAELAARRVCRRIRGKFEDRSLFPYSVSCLLQKLFEVQPIAALDELLIDDQAARQFHYFDGSGTSSPSPLDSIGIETLERWALVDQNTRIPRLANSIPLFTSFNDTEEGWSPKFLRLIELASEKGRSLENAGDRMCRSAGSGMYANTLDKRCAFLERLVQHPDPSISSWAVTQGHRLKAELQPLRTYGRRVDESFE